MALASNVWVSLADVKAFLDISSGDTDNDDLVTNLINQATTLVETYIDRTVLSTTYTNEVYDGNGANEILLNNYPVTALSSFQYRTNPGQNIDDWDDVDSQDYLYYSDGRLWKRTAFSEYPQQYRATYTAGWVAADVPADLSLAVMKVVGNLWNTRKSSGKEYEKLGEYSVKFRATKTIEDIEGLGDILNPYRRYLGA